MAKLQKASDDEIGALIHTADDLAHDLDEIANRIEKGYSDLSGTHDDSLMTLNRLARNALHLANNIHIRARMDRDAAELEVMLRLRQQEQ